MFSPEHLFALGAALMSGVLLAAVFWRVNPGHRARSITRCALAIILLGSELSWQWWQVQADIWDIRSSLPLHLCDIALLLSVVMLIWRIPVLFELIYFWAFSGSLHAMITPDLGQYEFPHFHFFQYFVSHGTVILATIYMAIAEHFRPYWSSIWKVFWVTNIYAFCVGMFNLATTSNYLMLSAKPAVPTVVDYLGPWPWYILGLEAIGLLSCILYYLPFAIKDGKNSLDRRKTNNDLTLDA